MDNSTETGADIPEGGTTGGSVALDCRADPSLYRYANVCYTVCVSVLEDMHVLCMYIYR